MEVTFTHLIFLFTIGYTAARLTVITLDDDQSLINFKVDGMYPEVGIVGMDFI